MNKEDTPNDKPYDPDISELTLWQLFYSDKKDWFEEKDGEQDWSRSSEKVKLFWSAVREEKMNEIDFDFSEFKFPVFTEESFWLKSERRDFARYVDFSFSTFPVGASFRGRHFQECTFSGGASFHLANFPGAVSFAFAKFSGPVYFGSVMFSGEADFSYVKFLEGAIFRKTEFGGAKFYSTTFNSEASYSFESWKVEKLISFRDIIFHKKVQFQSCDMSKTEFKSSDFVDAKFSNCSFGRRRRSNRLLFANDQYVIRKGNRKAKTDLSNAYRQLKKNRMDNNDWSIAGDAYRSEMVLKRKIIESDIRSGKIMKVVHWFVFIIHEVCSGYQQSYARPLISLAILISGAAGLIFRLEGLDSFQDALGQSVKAALPVVGRIGRDSYDTVYFILVFERIFSLILITFFVLTTRARMRQ